MYSVGMQIVWAAVAVVYAAVIVFLTQRIYLKLRARGVASNVAVYYNRKIVHMAAGGVVALAVPYLFTSPIYPLAIGLALTAFTLIPHVFDRRLEWLQTEENRNDVKFTLMWGVAIFVLWLLLDDPFLAILPPVFMAFGDGVTGVVRNALFKRRTKSSIGNLFMLAVCIPAGFLLAGQASLPIPWWGVIAGVVASIIERFELGPIDDNILITVASSAVLLIGAHVGPLG